jgi:DNA uptake protein ComE-like DNA-binding protein
MRVRPTSSTSSQRSGVVLLGVLIVIVILALIAYQYSDRMVAEYQGAQNALRAAQARHFADSGVHYAAMMLASPDAIANYLGGNPYDNPDQFQDILVPDAENSGAAGKFTLVAPLDPDQATVNSGYRAGVTDETGKININAAIKRDPTGQQLFDMLSKLPNVSTELAASIVDYVDSDTTPREEGGAEDEYYSGIASGGRAKNGPLDSIDELLLVKGMTRELLYGADINRNGIIDSEESGGTDRGLVTFLTVTSREPNRDSKGQLLVNVNGDDLQTLADSLSPYVGDDLVKFIIMYRQYGPVSSSGTSQSLGSSIAALLGSGASSKGGQTTQQTAQAGNLADFELDLTKAASRKLNSFYDLIGAQVSVPNPDRKKPATLYTSPFPSADKLDSTFSLLFQGATLNDDAEIPARININTAPREVLAAIDGLTEADVQNIIALRPKWGLSEAPSPEFQSPVWLASQGGLSLQTLKSLEKIVTTKSQVFHIQVVGQFQKGNGPTSRVEAIVDQNFGRPRIVYYRDLSELGRTKLR